MLETTLKKDEFYIQCTTLINSLGGARLLLALIADALEAANIDQSSVLTQIQYGAINLHFPTLAQTLITHIHVVGTTFRFKENNAKRGGYTEISLADPDMLNRLTQIFKHRVQKIRSKFLVEK